MRSLTPFLFSVVAVVGVVAGGNVIHAAQISEDGAQDQDQGGTGNVADPNMTNCSDLAARAENLAAAVADAYGKYQTGNYDLTADLQALLTDASDIAADIGPCTGRSPAVGDEGNDQGSDQGDDQGDDQEGQEGQEGQQEQQGQAAAEQSSAQQSKHHHGHHHRH